MENQRNLALIREQLKAKTREMKKQEAEWSKKEERVQQVLALSEQKITDLRDTITKQKETIQYQASKPSAPGGAADKGDAAKGETKEVTVQDPKLLKEVDELKNKNKDLSKKIDNEEKGRQQLEKEKSLLVKEFKKLRDESQGQVGELQKKVKEERTTSNESQSKFEDLAKEKDLLVNAKEKLAGEKSMLIEQIKKTKGDPDSSGKLKKKIKKLEDEIRGSVTRNEKLAKEKDELIKSYEKMLYVEDQEGGAKRMPSEIIGELKEEMGEMVEENEKMKKEIERTKKSFEDKLAEEKKKLEEQMTEQSKQRQREKTQDVVADEDGVPDWMVTFADLVTLLMVFFILFFSITKKNMDTMEAAIVGSGTAGIGLLELMNSIEITQSIQQLTGMETSDIVSEIEDMAEDQEMDVAMDKERIVVNVPGASLFQPGEARLIKEAQRVLGEIVKIAEKFPDYKINILGHTDNIDIDTERFPTNWELSAVRATAVLRFFLDKGIDVDRLTATGFADYRPIASNETRQGRARNRRVEFVLEKEKRF